MKSRGQSVRSGNNGRKISLYPSGAFVGVGKRVRGIGDHPDATLHEDKMKPFIVIQIWGHLIWIGRVK